MEKVIKIGDQDVRLSNRLSWALVYREQFGRDIIQSLMPAMAAALDVVSGLILETGKTEDIDLRDLAELANGEALINAVIHIGGVELVDFINVTWALAKAADRNVPDPETWAGQFDEFPVDEIAPVVFELITKGLVSTKNLERLKTIKASLRPQK